ncbi:MAG: DUF2007 domain-containing protein [bacterium]
MQKNRRDPEIKLVEVWRTHGEVEAQVIRSLLESNGIKAILAGEALRFVYGFTLDGLAEVKILVKSEDATKAREIITSIEQNP